MVRIYPGRRECLPSGHEPERHSFISHPSNASDVPVTSARPPSSLEQQQLFARSANMSGVRSAHVSRQSLRSGLLDTLATLNLIARRRWRSSWTSLDAPGASRGQECGGSARSATASFRTIRLSVQDVVTNGALSAPDHRKCFHVLIQHLLANQIQCQESES